MKKKVFWLGMLAVVLVFGMTVVGCDNKNKGPNDDRPMGPEWTMVANPPFGTSNIYDIAYGDGKFIAVGYSSGSNSRIAYSTDGINWSLVSSLSSSIYPHAIVYGNGKWITDDAYSTDGINWTEATNKLSISPRKIAYGGGKFIAIGTASGNQDKIASSSDGQTWDIAPNSPFGTQDNPDYVFIQDIVYGGGKFIVVGMDSKVNNSVRTDIPKIANSTDGINWTAVSPSHFGNRGIDCIAYGGGKFVASNGWDATAYSSDGTSWTPIIQNKLEGEYYSLSNLSFSYVAFGNNKWIGLKTISSSTMAYSSDGINWTPAFNPPDIPLPRAIYGNGKFVVIQTGSSSAGNGRIAYSAQ